MIRKQLSLAALSALAISFSAFGGSIINGSFESTSNVTTPGGGFAISNTGTLTGWSANSPFSAQLTCLVFAGKSNDVCGTVGFGSGLSFYGASTLSTSSPDGGNFVISDGESNFASPISQMLTGLTGGVTYNISFYQAGSQQTGFSSHSLINEYWQVSLGGQSLISATMAVAPSSFTNWTKQTLSFTLPNGAASNQLLSFLAVGPGGVPPILLLDGVSISSAAPEPTMGLLIGLGLISIPLVRKLRS